ncbi:protein NUCLEAR FUSION DEFECTIVE 6, chloroplastic/mitochondrial [Senna tora]|uniref:Protein NUCLEAR FUSION DEFECTIVE 6, chloroplastic/mitochondrial n=1 Tax=Senna tora TaxID=362788 RepID=A0A834W4N4_9FABA|nr:protein NUCLEAR FUSION DEFECTIVE 6, chloroplastic/mitochondrial [Senna tora]
MAATCARKTLQIASAQISRRSSAFASDATKLSGFGSCRSASASRVATQRRSLSFSWLPKELASAQVSMMPLHSVTSAALFTSLLSLSNYKWGCLSEGVQHVECGVENGGEKSDAEKCNGAPKATTAEVAVGASTTVVSGLRSVHWAIGVI